MLQEEDARDPGADSGGDGLSRQISASASQEADRVIFDVPEGSVCGDCVLVSHMGQEIEVVIPEGVLPGEKLEIQFTKT